MQRWILTLAGLLWAASAAQAQPPAGARERPAPPGAAAEMPSLTVTGNGEVRAVPDFATVQLGVTRQEETARPAQEQANAVMQRIITAVTGLGVPREKIQTSQLTLHPVHSNLLTNERGELRIVGYRATNTVSVRLEKLSLIAPVIDAGLGAGANQLEGVSFGVKDDLPLRQRALSEAVREARAKATAISNALGVQITGVQEVTEGGVSFRPLVLGRQAMAMEAGAATPVSPGQITLNATVTIRYRLSR